MRWDSPIILVTAGTAAIHTIILVFVDAMIVANPVIIQPPAPRIEMFEVKVEPPPVVKPAAAPVQARTEPPIKDAAKPPPQKAPPPQIKTATPPPDNLPTSNEPGGGDPVVSMPDIAPVGRGVPVAVGRRTNGHVGRGGTGGGTGAGSGSGSAEAPAPPPVSVATIKTRALPKGDQSYFGAGKEYPQEARQLGIEGPIRVRLVVDAKGKVAAAVLLNRLGHGLDELALTRAKKIEFEPAKDTDDKPVTSVVVWTFNMTLPK